MKQKKVNILMATFNGEDFLCDQIKSIVRQTYTNWELYIGDDGSHDRTRKIIANFETLDSRIHLIKFKDSGSHGQLLNFKRLMYYVEPLDYDYIMFADQDDVWHENKVTDTLDSMLQIEKGPTLIYTNYDENDIHGNLNLRYGSLFHKKYGMQQLLLQNWIMGCTMMINRELADLGISIPLEAENHDNWLVLVALTYGKIYYLDESTMMHRIHENNVTKNISQNKFLRPEKRFLNDLKNKKKFRNRNINLMVKLLSIDFKKTTNYALLFLKILNTRSKLKRIALMEKNGFVGLNLHKTIKFLLMV
ncbi:glycosyltransferase [Lactiplantibacillus nangangensis]|uniref:Glycosyltransferase n=1 Tax=Lactiplantibacillus nangangensis TaxID=2559917 RepID=A0ABW1SIY6_9LACO|nr:glycosyltransferase [Lactiplantibacillus nangangensis]